MHLPGSAKAESGARASRRLDLSCHSAFAIAKGEPRSGGGVVSPGRKSPGANWRAQTGAPWRQLLIKNRYGGLRFSWSLFYPFLKIAASFQVNAGYRAV